MDTLLDKLGAKVNSVITGFARFVSCGMDRDTSGIAAKMGFDPTMASLATAFKLGSTNAK